ncbi:hypothetical protein ACJMK2_016361 [Sinanodonta woodiana]|uniref:EF-hand domain-containing protein n=1 Tax=Sinanodonta woodiana TaxID=1069815 RepID=A0ABD3UTD0_SINWO
MKVAIKLVALILYLIMAINAAPKGNGEEGGGENEGAKAIETGGETKAGEAGVNVGEEGYNAVTVNLTTDFVKSQQPTAVVPTKEEPEVTSFVTEADTNKPTAGASSSVMSEVAPSTTETSTMLQVTTDDFSYLDQNGDGFLDYKEVFLGQNNVNPVYLNAAFQISDKNFDGVVDTREFFSNPLSWARVVAEKQFFAKAVSTSGPSTSETMTSQPDVTPTAEQTYTVSPDGTSPPLPEDNVNTTVPSAEQNTSGLTAVDQEPSAPTDNSTIAETNVVDQENGSQSVAVPDVTQGQKEVANGKDGSQVGSTAGTGTGSVITEGMAGGRPLGTGAVPSAEQNTTVLTAVDQQPSGPTDTSTRSLVSVADQANGGQSVAQPKVSEAGTDSVIGNRAGDMARDRRLGTGVVLNGNQMTARKEGAVAGSTGGQAGMATGQKDQKRTGAGSSGGQPSGVPGSVGGHVQRGGYDQKNGQAGFGGSAGGHTVTVTGKTGGHAKSLGVQHSTTGVQSGVSVHAGGKFHGRTVAHGHPQTALVSWPVKAQGHAGPQYHRWDGQKWVKTDIEQEAAREMGISFYGKSKVSEYDGIAKSAGIEKKYMPDLKKEGTKAAAQSEEEEEEESSNESEDNKNKNKNGKGNGDNESDNTDDNDEKDRK